MEFDAGDGSTFEVAVCFESDERRCEARDDAEESGLPALTTRFS